MSRSADYTIQGFIYQFNKTLLEVLKDTEGSEIAIEGIIEDIEIRSPLTTKAIQCKYHESQEKFTFSNIYEPILQMMNHYYENPTANIDYRLFAHFPNEESGSEKSLNKEEIEKIFKSKNQNLKKYIEKLQDTIDIEEFCNKFTLEFGSSLDELIIEVQKSLIANGMPKDDIDTLVYPNSIQIIADLSIIHDPIKRIIKKEDLLTNLKKIKKTAVSRWTQELKTLDVILKSRKKQLRESLTKNSRSRYFLISEYLIENFNGVIVTFISDYLNKYHFKEVHDKTPLFYLECSRDTFTNILVRLRKKQIKAHTGLIDSYFDKGLFLEGPFRTMNGRELYTEFNLRLLHHQNEHAINILNETKCEDCFIFMKKMPEDLDVEDLNVEHINLSDIQQIKFVMGMCDTYE